MDPKTSTTTEKHKLLLFAVVTTGFGLIPTIYACVSSNSTTLLADLLRCIAEFLAILFSWLVVRKISNNDAAQLNYGVGKLERLACISVAVALLVTFAVSLYTGIMRFITPEPVVNLEFGLALAVLSVAGNLYILIRTYLIYLKEPSALIESQWKLFRAKTFATSVVSCSLIFSWFYPTISYGDAVGSIILALFMLYSAISILTASVPDLIDRAVEERVQLVIMKVLIEHEKDYQGLTNIRTRRAGSKIFVEIFLTFDPQASLEKVGVAAKTITDKIKMLLHEAEVVVIPEPFHPTR